MRIELAALSSSPEHDTSYSSRIPGQNGAPLGTSPGYDTVASNMSFATEWCTLSSSPEHCASYSSRMLGHNPGATHPILVVFWGKTRRRSTTERILV